MNNNIIPTKGAFPCIAAAREMSHATIVGV